MESSVNSESQTTGEKMDEDETSDESDTDTSDDDSSSNDENVTDADVNVDEIDVTGTTPADGNSSGSETESYDDDETDVDDPGSREFTQSDSDGDNSSEKCPICLARIGKQAIGSLDVCDHAFCLDCIREWSKNINTCPLDRSVFELILVRDSINGVITDRIKVEKEAVDLDDTEDVTNCEICGRGDQEDRLLLCDGCNLGFHLHCLNPPLTRVPAGDWFCPTCDHQEAANEIETRFEIGRRRTARQIPRTIVAERVRHAVERIRVMRRPIILDSEDENQFLPVVDQEVHSTRGVKRSHSGTPRKPAKRRKKRKCGKKRKSSKKRTGRTIKKSADSTVGKKKVKKVGRRKSGKRKFSRQKEPRMKMLVSTAKKRLADRLNITTPATGQLLPRVAKSSTSNERFQSLRNNDNLPALSIMGNRNELLNFEDESDQQGTSSSAAKVNRLSKPICPILSSDYRAISKNNSTLDLLGDILLGQNLLHMNPANIKIQSDGSLKPLKSIDFDKKHTSSRQNSVNPVTSSITLEQKDRSETNGTVAKSVKSVDVGKSEASCSNSSQNAKVVGLSSLNSKEKADPMSGVSNHKEDSSKYENLVKKDDNLWGAETDNLLLNITNMQAIFGSDVQMSLNSQTDDPSVKKSFADGSRFGVIQGKPDLSKSNCVDPECRVYVEAGKEMTRLGKLEDDEEEECVVTLSSDDEVKAEPLKVAVRSVPIVRRGNEVDEKERNETVELASVGTMQEATKVVEREDRALWRSSENEQSCSKTTRRGSMGSRSRGDEHVGFRERVGSREYVGSREHVGSCERVGSREHVGSQERGGSRERVGSREHVGLRERGGSQEHVGSRERVGSYERVGSREHDSSSHHNHKRFQSGLREDDHNSSRRLNNCEPPRSGEPPRSNEPPGSGEPLRSGEPPRSGAPPRSGEPPRSGVPPRSGEPPRNGETPRIGEPPRNGDPRSGAVSRESRHGFIPRESRQRRSCSRSSEFDNVNRRPTSFNDRSKLSNVDSHCTDEGRYPRIQRDEFARFENLHRETDGRVEDFAERTKNNRLLAPKRHQEISLLQSHTAPSGSLNEFTSNCKTNAPKDIYPYINMNPIAVNNSFAHLRLPWPNYANACGFSLQPAMSFMPYPPPSFNSGFSRACNGVFDANALPANAPAPMLGMPLPSFIGNIQPVAPVSHVVESREADSNKSQYSSKTTDSESLLNTNNDRSIGGIANATNKPATKPPSSCFAMDSREVPSTNTVRHSALIHNPPNQVEVSKDDSKKPQNSRKSANFSSPDGSTNSKASSNQMNDMKQMKPPSRSTAMDVSVNNSTLIAISSSPIYISHDSPLYTVLSDDDEKPAVSNSSGSAGEITSNADSSAFEIQENKVARLKVAVKIVKDVLIPYFYGGKITKEEYKDIMRRAVPKITHSKNTRISRPKVESFIQNYVTMVTADRKPAPVFSNVPLKSSAKNAIKMDKKSHDGV